MITSSLESNNNVVAIYKDGKVVSKVFSDDRNTLNSSNYFSPRPTAANNASQIMALSNNRNLFSARINRDTTNTDSKSINAFRVVDKKQVN